MARIKYPFLIGLQKSSIVICFRGLSTAIVGVSFYVFPCSTVTGTSAIFTFFRFLNVLSNSVSNGSSYATGLLRM